MSKVRKFLAQFLLSSIILICFNYRYVYGYITDRSNDDIWSTFKTDGDKVIDWGLGVVYSNSPTSLQAGGPPSWIDKVSRRTHNLDNKSYYDSTILVTPDDDKRGWTFRGAGWVDENSYRYNYSKISEYETNGFDPFGAYGLPFGLEDKGRNAFNPPGYASAPYQYRRFFITDYERDKPTPIHGKTYIQLSNNNTYINGSQLWVKPGQDITIRTYGYDKYPYAYGQNAQYEAMLKSNTIQVESPDGATLFARTVDEKSGTSYTYASRNNGASILRSTSMYWRGYTYGNRDNVDGYYLNGIGSQMVINPNNNQDLYLKTNHLNKYDVWANSGWFSYFALNSDGYENLSVLRTDSDAPTITKAYIDNVTYDSFDIVVEGLSDNGRSGVKKIQFPTWTINGGQDDIQWYEQYTTGGTVRYTVYRSNHKNEYWNYQTDIYTEDNLGNRKYVDTVTVNLKPQVPDIYPNEINLSGYDYEDDNNTYWVNTKTTFTATVSGTTSFQSPYYDISGLYVITNPFASGKGAATMRNFNAFLSHDKASGGEFTLGTNNFNTSLNYSASSNSIINRTNGVTTGQFKLKFNNDGENVLLSPILRIHDYDMTILKDTGIYGDAIHVRSDSRFPTCSITYENISPHGFDVVVGNLTDNGGSGVKNIAINVWTDNNGDDDINSKAFVMNLYKNYLGRDANTLELSTYMQNIKFAKWLEKDAVISIINTNEFKNKNMDNTNFIKATYKTLLRRDATVEELKECNNKLNTGTTRNELIEETTMEYDYQLKSINGYEDWDGKYRYHVNTADHNYEADCDYKVEVYTDDNVENYGSASNITVKVPSPNPINLGLQVIKSDYQDKDNSNVYWVKPNSVFGIKTEGYFPTNYDIYPSRTYVLFAKDGSMNSNSARQWASSETFGNYGSEFNQYFNTVDLDSLYGDEYPNVDDKAEELEENGKNVLRYTHYLSAKQDKTQFKLYSTNTYFYNNSERYSSYLDSLKYLKVDGQAPTGLGKISYFDDKNLNVDLTAYNLSDNGGSGIKQVYAKVNPYTFKDDKFDIDYDDESIILLNKQDETTYKTDRFDAYGLFGSEGIHIEIFTRDNVGNEKSIYQENLDLFTVKARVVPSNNKSYNKETPPTLKEGQEGVLIIDTTGETESLNIEFEELDNSLNKTIEIEKPQRFKQVESNFIVPLYCEDKKYKVKVTAYRDGSTRVAYPEFIVSDSVLHGIKTKIKN